MKDQKEKKEQEWHFIPPPMKDAIIFAQWREMALRAIFSSLGIPKEYFECDKRDSGTRA